MLQKFRIWTELIAKNCVIFVMKTLYVLIFWTSFGLGFWISWTFWTMVGLRLSFKNSGLDLDCKIWQSAHLWCYVGRRVGVGSGQMQGLHKIPFAFKWTTKCGVVAASPVVLRWLCVSPRTGCAWEITPLYMWSEQAIVREIASMISIVACCHGAKLCAYAARDFRSHQCQAKFLTSRHIRMCRA